MADKGSRVVGRSVVDDDHTVVVVILVENRLEVELVSEILSVIEGRHDDTERQLSLVLTHVVDGLEAVLLLLQLLVNLGLLHRVDEGRLDVVTLEDPGVPPLFRLEVLGLGQLVECGYLVLADYLLCVVLQKLENGSLLPEGVVDEIDPLENGEFLLGFLLQCLPVDFLPVLGLFQKFLQNLDTFIQLTEELEFEFYVLTLLFVDGLLDAGDIEGDGFDFVTRFGEEMLITVTGALNTDQLHAEQDHEDHRTGEGNALDLHLAALIPTVPLLTEGLPPQKIHSRFSLN
jgi:hypothetical protein